MRVLLDNNVHQDFAGLLPDHGVVHARELGWARRLNGDLLAAAEGAGFDALVTGDKNLRYQQNLAERKIVIKWSHIAPLAPQVLAFLDSGPESGAFYVADPEKP